MGCGVDLVEAEGRETDLRAAGLYPPTGASQPLWCITAPLVSTTRPSPRGRDHRELVDAKRTKDGPTDWLPILRLCPRVTNAG